MGTYHKVATRKQLPPGASLAVEVGGRRIALVHAEGTIYAIGDECTHRGGPLSEGVLSGTAVCCPWHGAEFDLRTGMPLGPPAEKPVPTYRVRVSGEDIEVEV
jgi:nitrite reductase/ring-hydroxylating ferredoxin subunit